MLRRHGSTGNNMFVNVLYKYPLHVNTAYRIWYMYGYSAKWKRIVPFIEIEYVLFYKRINIYNTYVRTCNEANDLCRPSVVVKKEYATEKSNYYFTDQSISIETSWTKRSNAFSRWVPDEYTVHVIHFVSAHTAYGESVTLLAGIYGHKAALSFRRRRCHRRPAWSFRFCDVVIIAAAVAFFHAIVVISNVWFTA